MTGIRLDPVMAYDRIAREFRAVSERRRSYLSAIEQLIISEIPAGSRTLLDIGAGDGARALRVAEAGRIERPVLLEPSAAMRLQWPAGTQGWALRAEELSGRTERFDVILCLWNVLGHIFPAERRTEVLRHCSRMLSPHGRLFLDVNHRYNAAEYGILPTGVRILKDVLRPDVRNGDVVVRWNLDGAECVTDGHVFTDAEFRRGAERADLQIEREVWVNYTTGRICRSKFKGNPLFTLRRA